MEPVITSSHDRRRRRIVLIAACASLIGSLAAPSAVAGAEQRPSIVLIVTDDQRADLLPAMPVVNRELGGDGVTFTRAVVSNPLCCPSRASILTGRYAHSTGVYRQIPPYGRYEWFDDDDTIATRLDDAGYTTGLFGKYLDGYQHAALTGEIPPGWDRWEAFVRSGYVDYRLTRDGTIVDHGDAPEDYATDVLAADAETFVRETEGPLFLTFAPPAPHAPAIPAPRHARVTIEEPPTATPAVGEADVGDKPGYIRALPPLGAERRAALEELRARQQRSLLAVDEGIAGILDALADTGRLHDTLVVFTSDNGLLLGEHRWTAKEVPYEEAIRVPLVVRYDPLTSGQARADDALVANIDLAPTIAEVAGVGLDRPDGRSLADLLRGEDDGWRDAVLLEHLRGTNPVPTYCGLRTEDHTYVEYETGERELYDLRSDPFQLRNLADAPASADTVAALRDRLARLCVPAPPGLRGRRIAPAIAAAGVLSLLVALAALGERARTRRRGQGA